jgi:plastocyanin
LIACALLACSGVVVAGDAVVSPAAHVVVIEGMRFNPPALTVRRGARVTWINKDLFPHTASASSNAFDSHSIAPNASWTYTARKPGSYPYTCRFHPAMQGTLTVQ